MKKCTLKYPSHRFTPEDLLSFVELRPFTALWSKLNLTDDDLLLLQIAIMCGPQVPPVIAGTRGLRKIRFSPFGLPAGKRDAFRACYVFFEEFKTVALSLVYPKTTRTILPQKKRNASIGQLRKSRRNSPAKSGSRR